MVVIARYALLDAEGRRYMIKQQLVQLEILAKTINARELARVLVVCLGNPTNCSVLCGMALRFTELPFITRSSHIQLL